MFVTNFKKFERAVDEMGCVYMTVDKRYYHVNEPGGEQYFEINLQPGYQRLCGKQALEFVANRHESTSLIRDARDQRFLLETKAEYGAKLFENREKFEHILGKAMETDLHGEEGCSSCSSCWSNRPASRCARCPSTSPCCPPTTPPHHNRSRKRRSPS